MNFLVDIATDLFICRSIQDVTIKDIAVSAQVQIFIHHPEFYKFINEFDSFISSEDPTSSDVIDPYESVVGQYEKVYMKAYEEGIKDGSVKEQRDISMFYFATTHALLELCKKLSIKAAVLNQDKVIEKQAQVECMIDIVLSTLNNN